MVLWIDEERQVPWDRSYSLVFLRVIFRSDGSAFLGTFFEGKINGRGILYNDNGAIGEVGEFSGKTRTK